MKVLLESLYAVSFLAASLLGIYKLLAHLLGVT